MKVNFLINGECESKERPRFDRRGHAYTANKTRVFEEFIKLSYGRRHYFDTNLIRLTIDIYSKRPKNPKHMRPTKKDLDNMVKAILDALNGIAYKDDRYICELHTSKAYSDNPRVEVSIEDL